MPDQVRHDDTYTVIPAHDCMDAGGRAKQEARAEAGIQEFTDWMPDYGFAASS